MNIHDINQKLLNNIYFDTCVYHQPGINLLTEVIPIKNILFASETFGAVKDIDPDSGFYFDDTRRYLNAVNGLNEQEKSMIFEGNARKVFSRINNRVPK
jgi:4-oxalmesaconate hydratase